MHVDNFDILCRDVTAPMEFFVNRELSGLACCARLRISGAFSAFVANKNC